MGSWFKTVLLVEAVFYIYYQYRVYKATSSTPPPKKTAGEILKLGRKVLHAVSLTGKSGDPEFAIRQFLKGWFKGTPAEDLSIHDLELLLSNNFFHLNPDELSDKQADVVSTLVKECCSAAGLNPKHIGEKTAPYICLPRDKVQAAHRPFLVYLLIRQFNALACSKLVRAGYRNQGNYWIRPATSISAKKPLIFFHGITPGMFPYVGFIKELPNDRDVFVVELPWVAMTGRRIIPCPRNFVKTIGNMLEECGATDACVVAHSYGTIVTSWLLKADPKRVSSLVLVDPVPLLCALPHTAARLALNRSAFEPDRNISFGKRIYKTIVDYISIREIGVAETLFRNNCWTLSLLLVGDFNVHTTVVLSMKDILMASRKVKRYIERTNIEASRTSKIEMLCFEDHGHGEFLSNGRGAVLRVINRHV